MVKEFQRTWLLINYSVYGIKAHISHGNFILIYQQSYKVMIYLLLTFFAVATCSGQQYFSIPYTTYLSEISATHRVNIQINRYPYQIDFTLNSAEDRIISLDSDIQERQTSNRPDYRKNDQSVFGIVEFVGTQYADSRLEWKKWIFYNIYYYVRDFSQQITWLNLNGVKQIPQNDWDLSKGDGSFNFGPKNSGSQILRNFKKYSKYMKDTIITFRGNTFDDNGEIIFGAFPNEIVKDPVYTTTLEQLSEDFWIMNTIGLNLKRKNGSPIELYKESVRMRLTISERTIVIPATAAKILSKSLPKCTFQIIDFQAKSGNYMSCKNMKKEDFKDISLDFTIRGSELPISIYLKDLEITSDGSMFWFAVRSSEAEEYQIGQAILRKYAIGIDYQQDQMIYGLLAEKPFLNRGTFIKFFITFNVLLFLISAILVAFEKEIRIKMKKDVEKQLGLSEEDAPSKKNSYQLANVSEESLVE